MSKKKKHSNKKSNKNLETNKKHDVEHIQAEKEAVEKLVEETAYPDISKANTKSVVIGSAIVVLIVLLLSIFIPPTTESNTTTENATGEESTTTSTKATPSNKLSSDAIPWLEPEHRIANAQSGFQTIAGDTYYLQEGETPFTGWLNINDFCYYIQDDGTMSIGWKKIAGKWYYFSLDGHMLTEQWINNRYVGSDGVMYTSTLTPDGIYVDKDGHIDISLGTTNSTQGLTDLKTTLDEMLSSYRGTWSIYVKDLENNEYLSINNTQIFSASLIKLYCGAAAYDLMDKGILEETERINSLMVQMLSISDNDAFCLMVAECSGTNSQVAGRPVIQDYIDREGYKDTTLTSMLLPTKYRAPSSPGRNLTTVEDCGLLLEKIYKGKCVNPEVSEKFLDLLLNQSHVNKIPSGLPEGTKCANKTGDTDEFQHDAAIVYSPGGDYIITIMSENGGASISNIRTLSETVYNYFN
ncbi:MAG: serine hydrolase [Lachnospiraceae bacterium]|nr:serine hydrolase [Lachnospiraceae bacterium]